WLRFLQECRKRGIPVDHRLAVWALDKGEEGLAGQLPIAAWWALLEIPLPSFRRLFRRFVVDRKGEGQPLRPGAELVLLGTFHQTKANLAAQIETAGLKVAIVPGSQTTHIVLGQRPPYFEMLERLPLTWTTEAAVLEYCREKAPSYLQRTAEPASLERLRTMLSSDREEQLRLALQLLEGGGVPAAVLNELYAAYRLTGSAELKRRTMRLLRSAVGRSGQEFLRKRIPLEPVDRAREQLTRAAEGTEFDGSLLAALLCK
ncbi:MAG: hypothetical protein KDC41_05135, partial [Saprospiraceae bacterium]|nr:hypothetical protein [Saprospiraceae bacterium]